MKSCEGEITKSEYKKGDRTVPEEKPKGVQIWSVMEAQAMGNDRVLVNGKEKDGLHLAMLQLYQYRDRGEKKATGLKNYKRK